MYNKTNWQDHVTEFDNRFREQNNADGTISHIPVEGEIIQQGTPQNAANFNKMENGIFENNEFSAVIVQEVKNIKNQISEKDNNVEEIAKSAKETANSANSTAEEALEKADKALLASQNAQNAADAALSALTKQTKIINALPTQNETFTYSGEELSPKWNSFDETKLDIGGDISATNAGTYTATFTPKDGYMWNDETTDAKSVNWTINRASIAVPSQSGNLAYTGSAQSPTWSGYDSGKMTVSGTTSGTNASSYTAIFTPKENYQWSDGSTSDKIITWNIEKAAGSLSLSKTSVTLNVSALTAIVTVTKTGNGAVTAISSDSTKASVSVSGTTITITAQNSGNAVITVNAASDTNHNASGKKTITVTVDMPSETLTDNSPENIRAAARAGTAANYWSIGDKVAIKLNGVVGQYTFSNEVCYAFIIGFNHNSSVEGNNTIHFQFGKDSSGTDIAFCDGAYNLDVTTGTGFIINTALTNVGGWNGSYMRKTVCPAFLNAMPSEWQDVITPCTKYSDNTGGGNDTASFVTATSDKIWLLSEFEVWGKKARANSAEQNYQKQYDYYRNGNSKVKGKHLEKNKTCIWLLRSVSSDTSVHFCATNTASTTNVASMGVTAANRSQGFAPGFKVA